MPETLVHFGGAVKALGDGKVGGYLVRFSDESSPDLTGDFFTKNTDFDVEDGDRRSTYYAHGLDRRMGVKKIGTLTVKTDEVGVWVESQLKMRDAYEQSIYDLAAKGKLGWSSGAPSHLVTRKAVEAGGAKIHEILTWPIAEGSLTPTPAEPRNDAIALKSLGALIGMEKAPATKSRADFTYDDLRALLEQEWNEDFGAGGMGDPYGDSWSRQWHVVAMDDATCVAQQGSQGELTRRAYTVTSGNDVLWGDPEEVARTTSFVAVTDADDTMVPLAAKQADVTALKAMLRDSMTFSDHADVATSAMEGFATRAAGLTDMSIKAGRAISSANREKLRRIHAAMTTTHTAMAGHLEQINNLLLSTDPDAKKDADEMAMLRTQFIRIQSTQLRATG